MDRGPRVRAEWSRPGLQGMQLEFHAYLIFNAYLYMFLHLLFIIHLLDIYIIPRAARESKGSVLVLNIISFYFVKRRRLKCVPLFSVLM